MKIISEINNKTIQESVQLVLTHYKDAGFRDIIAHARFNHTNDSGLDIYWKTFDFYQIVYIKAYTTFSPWSSVIGYAKGNTIYVNTRKLHLPLKDRVENIRHEIFHLQGYSHKGNRVTEYNLKTVPFKGAALFVKYLESIGKL